MWWGPLLSARVPGYTPFMNESEHLLQEVTDLQQAGRWDDALALLDQLSQPLSFQAHQARGRSLYRLSRVKEAESAFAAALDVALLGGDREQIAAGHMSLGASLFEQSRFLDAAEHLKQSLAYYDNRNCRGLANALNWLAQTYQRMDLWDLAAETFTRGLELAVRIGARDIEAFIRSNSGLMQMLMKDNRAAEASFRNALRLNREIGNSYGIADTLSNIGIALHADERYEEAEPWLREGMESHAALGAALKEIMVSLYLADTLRAMGQRDDALHLVRTGLARMDEDCSNFMRIQVLDLAFNQYMDMGMLEEAGQTLESLKEFLEQREMSLADQATFHRFQAKMSHATGDLQGVFEHFSKAFDLNDQLTMKQNAMFTAYLSMHEQAMRAEMETRLAKSQKFESLGILCAGIAHDFNNSLHAILGSVEGISGNDDISGKVERIRSAVTDSADLCRHLLAFAGHASMNPEVVDVNGAVAEVISLINPLTSGIDLLWEPAEGLAPVEVDPVQLKNWVISILTNSLEALDGAGTVTISTSMRRGEKPDAVSMPSITIADNGPGIPCELLDKVFDPYFSTKSISRGMGLAEIKGSVESIGGEISLRSEPRILTEFTIMLPPASDVPETVPRSIVDLDPGGRTVGIVDDDRNVREVTASMLEFLGYRNVCWSDGESFLQDLGTGDPPDCILLDMTMPGLLGSQVFVSIRESGINCPVIIMSGFSSRESMAHFQGEIPCYFLHKPFSTLQLRDALNTALGS